MARDVQVQYPTTNHAKITVTVTEIAQAKFAVKRDVHDSAEIQVSILPLFNFNWCKGI